MNQKNQNFRIFNIANMMSMTRVLLMLPILYLFNKNTPESKLLLFLVMALAIFTDYLDGFLARKFNQESELGKIIDPLADKICIGLLVIYLIIYRDLPKWFVIVAYQEMCCLYWAHFFSWTKRSKSCHRINPENGRFSFFH